MDSVGEGEGGKIWENGIETCIISCMKRVANPGSMPDTGCLGLVCYFQQIIWKQKISMLCNFLTDFEFGKSTFFKVYNENIAPRLPLISIF